MARRKKEILRNKIVPIRFTEEEYKRLISVIGKRPLSSYIREAVLSKKTIVLGSPEFINQLKDISLERKKTGNNINQLAKYANQLNIIGLSNPSVIDDLNSKLESLIKIERKVGEEVSKLFDS